MDGMKSCVKCETLFSRRSKRLSELKYIELIKRHRNITCHICNEILSTRLRYHRHRRSTLLGEGKIYNCNLDHELTNYNICLINKLKNSGTKNELKVNKCKYCKKLHLRNLLCKNKITCEVLLKKYENKIQRQNKIKITKENPKIKLRLSFSKKENTYITSL